MLRLDAVLIAELYEMAPNDAMAGCATRCAMRDAARLDAEIHLTDCVFPCCARRTVAEGSTERPVLDLPPMPVKKSKATYSFNFDVINNKRAKKHMSVEAILEKALKAKAAAMKQIPLRSEVSVLEREKKAAYNSVVSAMALMNTSFLQIDGNHINLDERVMGSMDADEKREALEEAGFNEDEILKIETALAKKSTRIKYDLNLKLKDGSQIRITARDNAVADE